MLVFLSVKFVLYYIYIYIEREREREREKSLSRVNDIGKL